MLKKVIFAGSFDPLHEGHIFVIKEALKKSEEVFVVVAINWKKRNKPSLDKRFTETQAKLKQYKRVKVIKLEKGLVATLAKELGVTHLIRGVRNKNDQLYEEKIDQTSKRYNNNLKTIFVTSPPKYQNINSESIRNQNK